MTIIFTIKKLYFINLSIKNGDICITGFYCVNESKKIFKTISTMRIIFQQKSYTNKRQF